MGRVRQDRQRCRAAGTELAQVALAGEDLGDPGHDGVEVDHLAGTGPRDDRLEAVLGGLPGPDPLTGLGLQPARLRGLRVGVDDESFEPLQVGAPGLGADPLGRALVDPARLLQAETELLAADQPGGLEGLPGGHLAGEDAAPQPRVPVAEVGHLAEVGGPGQRVHAVQGGVLSTGELADRGRAVGARRHPALGARQGPARALDVRLLHLSVQVDPVRRQTELTDLDRDLLGLCRGQRLARARDVVGQVVCHRTSRALDHGTNARRDRRHFSAAGAAGPGAARPGVATCQGDW